MMPAFWFAAGVLVGVTATLVIVPLWRGMAGAFGAGRFRYALAGGFLATFAIAAVIIYLVVGSRHTIDTRSALTAPPHPMNSSPSPGGAPAKSMDAEVAALEARLAAKGGTAADWQLLAQAYDFLGRKDDARRAREKGGTLSPGMLAMASASLSQTPGAPQPGAAQGAQGAGPGAQDPFAQPSAGASSEPQPTAEPSLPELQARVHKNPRDVEALLSLADIHRRHREYAQAREAFEKVIVLKAMTSQGWADYADVLASQSGGSLAGEPARAVDRALALDPNNVKALWLKASLAHEQHRYAQALSLWRQLRSVLPADSPDLRIIDSNISEASALAGGAPQPASPMTPEPAPSRTAQAQAQSPMAITAAGNAAGTSSVEVSGTVSIDSRFASRVPRDAILFIYAKAADSPGPPLAVIRTTPSAWPVSFRLDDSMAMIPSRRLSQFDKVVIEARISQSGQAAPSPGDLYVRSDVLRPAGSKKLALVINREIG